MPEQEQLDLMIILEIVRYLRLREERTTQNPDENALLINIVRNLPPGVNINSLVNSQTIQVQETMMGDHYETGQAGAVGPNSIAIGQHFTQVWHRQVGEIDLNQLAQELRKVRDKGRAAASGSPEEDMALAELANAEVAAQQGDGPRALSHLARAGQWALRIAVAVGVPVAVKAIQTAIGS
jgi:hypothetical protein